MQLKGQYSKLAIMVMTNKQAKIQETFSKKNKMKKSKEQQHVLWQFNHCMTFYFDLNYIYIFIIKDLLKNFQIYF